MKAVYPNLMAKLEELDLGIAELADVAGVSWSEAERKLTGKSEWDLHEVVRICQYFNCHDANLLFVRFDSKRNKTQSQA